MLCLKPDGTPYDGADAARRRCQDFVKNPTLKATAFAHHPYTKKVAPTVAPKNPDEITIANIGTLGPLLDTLAAQSGGKIAADLPIFLTEFGYESEPDPRNGIPLLRQAEFNQLAEFLAYNDPRVAATTQFLLKDAAPLRRSPVTGKAYKVGSREYWFTYQSGLYNTRNRAKPAAYAYTFPLVVYPGRRGHRRLLGAGALPAQRSDRTRSSSSGGPIARVAVAAAHGVVTDVAARFFSGSVAASRAPAASTPRRTRAADGAPAIGAYSLPAKLG